jgi:hypothetical protein
MKKHGALVTIVVLCLLGLVAALEVKRQEVSSQLEDITGHLDQIQFDVPNNGQETADQILKELRNLMNIPEDTEPTVATIVDVELLRVKNPFYAKAENGDHLIVTPTRAILYSSKTKRIIDVAPVQLQPIEAVKKEEEEGSTEE